MTRPLDHPLLADENLHPGVVDGLRARGHDILTVVERGLAGSSDLKIVRAALEDGRVILTHDSDFGTIAIRQGEPWTGIIHIRPGHASSEFVLGVLDVVADLDVDVEFPFLLVAARRGSDIKIRLRTPAAESPEDPG